MAPLIAGSALGASREENLADPIIGEEKAVPTDAPNVPPPITRDHATKVIVDLEMRELEGRLADGVRYTFWTFGGHVPGKFVRIREGDEVEFHLDNHPTTRIRTTSTVFSFKAPNPRLCVYHCATAPVAMHVANGMYGLIFVEPKGGLPKVDHEYHSNAG